MNDRNLLIHLDPKEGYNKIFDVGEYDMRLTKFGLIKLSKGASYSDTTGEMEAALVLMGGNFKASGEGWEFTVENGRKSPFTGKPHCRNRRAGPHTLVPAFPWISGSCIS